MHMKLRIFYLIIFTFVSIYCFGENTGDTFSFLDSIVNARLSDKTEIQEQTGSFVEHSTVGEKELLRILTDSIFKEAEKNEFIKLILLNRNLYHLHRVAGLEIRGDDKLKADILQNVPNNYLKLRAIISIEDEIFYSGGDFHELKLEKIEEILTLINNPQIDDTIKKYFIETLYSLSSKAETGKMIYARIAEFNLNDLLKQYNSQLFQSFELYKPVYEQLHAITTWKEMDRNKDQLTKLFQCKQPIMFFQILSQNPSTVLGSKELSRLKNDAILNIIQTAETNSFFHDLRIFYFVQFLIERNYSIRFLETIMTEMEREKYLSNLEVQ